MKRVLLNSLLYKVTLACLAAFFIYFLIWSDIGVVRHCSIRKQIEAMKSDFLALQSEVKELEGTIVAWESSPFYLEKMAREELGMGYPDEIVYFYRS